MLNLPGSTSARQLIANSGCSTLATSFFLCLGRAKRVAHRREYSPHRTVIPREGSESRDLRFLLLTEALPSRSKPHNFGASRIKPIVTPPGATMDSMDRQPAANLDRRTFVKAAAASIAAQQIFAANLRADAPENNGMIYRTLGRTGERVSAIGLGGYHIGKRQPRSSDAIQLIHQAIDRGINFLDNCWDYNDGVSELRMGKALADGYRAKVFLMTKIDGRTQAAAAQQIDESLQRLQTDHVDLMQFHEVIRLEDPDRIFAEGGAMEAMLDAQEGRQGALHRLHRPQGSATSTCACSTSRAQHSSISTPCRCRST